MTRRMIVPLVFGIVGAAILAGLGTWQVQRLEWKKAILAEISAKIATDPIAIPENPDPDLLNYHAATASGRLDGPEIHVLTGRKREGPGFRVIRALTMADGRRVLADLGFVAEAGKGTARAATDVTIVGNLIWPDETDGFTPAPNLDRNIWFARDTDKMAAQLQTEPVMIAARARTSYDDIIPMPVTVNIPNDHLEYAITWFSLMVIWIGMTAFLLWRIKRADD